MYINQGKARYNMDKQFVAIAPFFEQLTEKSEFCKTEHQNTKIMLKKSQLLESIRKELTDIFETRSSLSFARVSELIENVKENLLSGIVGFMGFPTMSNIFAEDPSSWRDLEERCKLIIKLYEPRLYEPMVQVESFDVKQQSLILTVSGSLLLNDYREYVSFPISLDIGA